VASRFAGAELQAQRNTLQLPLFQKKEEVSKQNWGT
jgi:hypothetical protein